MRFISVLAGLLTLLTFSATAQLSRPSALSASREPSVAQVLNPDGTLRPGGTGAFDARGYHLDTTRRGAPVLRPTQAGDENWHLGFGTPGVEGSVFALTPDGAGAVYVGGDFHQVGAIETVGVARWDSTGWHPLGAGVPGAVNAIAVVGTDVYVGGRFTQAGGVAANNVARWDGTAWHALGTGLGGGLSAAPTTVTALAVRGRDLFVTGDFRTAGGVSAPGIARWDGTAWHALGTGFDRPGVALLVDGTDLYAGGSFLQAGNTAAACVARWDGTAWHPLGAGLSNGTNFSPAACAIVRLGSDLYVGGTFTRNYGAPTSYLARWDGTAWHPLAQPLNNAVFTLLTEGTDLYAGGLIDIVSGAVWPTHVAKWDGTSWTVLAEGPESTVRAICRPAPGKLWAGGSFVRIKAQMLYANNLAEWDGARWWCVTTSVHPGGGGLPSLNSVAIIGADVYVTGGFDKAGAVMANNIARWDGTRWHALGRGLEHADFGAAGYTLLVRGTDLYVGGRFLLAGGDTANNIARWDGSAWHALGTGTDDLVTSLLDADSVLYVGGSFRRAGGAPARRLARWDGTRWRSVARYGPYSSIVSAPVESMALLGTDLYVCGRFTEFGSPAVVVNALARWDGTTWSDIGGGFRSDEVHRLSVIGGELYVGGDFVQAGGQPANYVARWDGQAWHGVGTLAPATPPASFPFQMYDLQATGGRLYAAGHFTVPGTPGSHNVAVWNGTTWQGLGSGLNGPVFGVAVADSTVGVVGFFSHVADSSRMTAGVGVFNARALLTAVPAAVSSGAGRLRLYPNPASTTVRVELPGNPHESLMGLVFNDQGREVRRAPVSAWRPLDVGGLAPGLYLVRVGSATARLLIQ